MAIIPAEDVESAPEEMTGEQATTIIPPGMTGGQEFKAGDVIQLEVVGVDDDGSLTVKYHEVESSPEDEGPMEAMDRHFAEKGAGPGSEPTY
jgi:hypothetical protein